MPAYTNQVSRGFKDISFSFTRHPVTNDIVVLKNEDAIKKSVVNLCRTKLNERFFNELLGTQIEDSLFDLNNGDQVYTSGSGGIFKSGIPVGEINIIDESRDCLLYTSPSPRDVEESRMPSSA